MRLTNWKEALSCELKYDPYRGPFPYPALAVRPMCNHSAVKLEYPAITKTNRMRQNQGERSI